MTASDVRGQLPLSPAAFYILLALAAGDRHGYGIIKEVDAHSQGTVKLGPGTLYRVIKQLLADGWISEIEGDPGADPERRRNYRLSERGRVMARAKPNASIVSLRSRVHAIFCLRILAHSIDR